MKINRAQGLYDPQFEHDSCGVGFVVNMKGKKSNDIVKKGLQILVRLSHRGACGCEENTGDGAGMLMQIPHEFFAEVCAPKFELPTAGEYAVGMVFLPPERVKRREIEDICSEIIQAEGQRLIGWRTVPTNNESLGETAKLQEPLVRQVFIGKGVGVKSAADFERKLYIIRRRITKSIVYSGILGSDFFYFSSLSSKTVAYKGMLMPEQLEAYFPELTHPRMESALAMVHSRFSTNTFPSWDRSQPFRYVAHNGEINTLRGNVNWMRAREAVLKSKLFKKDIEKIKPIILTDGSDSSMFDNAFEFLVLSGRSMAHAAMMMIPEPWSNHEGMSEERKAFYEYHSCLMEPWDGPASIAFTDGEQIGALLDRNGLRPSRYYVTKDDMVIMASEVGVVEVEPENVLHKGRLQPGRMFLIDTKQGRIISDEEIKDQIVKEHPYKKWLDENLVRIENLPEVPVVEQPTHHTVLVRQKAFGYTQEDLNIMLAPMAKNAIEPIGAMGNDTPLAVLSEKPQLMYNYFKQQFAQVTNPPIDSIREEIITSTETTIGSEGNLLDPQPENSRMIKLKSPVLSNEDLEKLRRINRPGFKSETLPIVYDVKGGGEALENALEELFEKADKAIADGVNIIILSDKWLLTPEKAAIPAMLAVSGLHHHLIRQGTRTKVGIVLESGEPREVHHFALLTGYGVGAVNPYLVFETLKELINTGQLTDVDYEHAVKNYGKAIVKGIVKTMAKMGISTIQSYRGAQIFEAVGLNSEVIDKYFAWTASRVEGIGMEEIAKEAQIRHEKAFPSREGAEELLEAGGNFKWRKDGERHLFNPMTIHLLQKACRVGSYDVFKEYAGLINNQAKSLYTLRGLLEMKPAAEPIPLEEVESAESIMKRFKTGAMSFGSISKEAHETLAVAMNRLGGKSNTGEGGEDPSRFTPEDNGDSKNSAIKQVASGRFGVTSHYLVNAKEIQIKMAQGAKPGEGGQLPGPKVYPWVAKVRHSTPGVGLISPPPHHDIYSIEDLAELIHDLKNANRDARISVKLVSEVGVGTVAAGVAKAHADVVLISGYDGGTGASPLSSIKNAGMPWELGLAETHQTLLINNLRSRITVEADGQMKTGRDVAIAALLGAEEFGFATAPLVVMGCVMMRVCHNNTCPVGVATQDPELRKKFKGQPEHVVNFMRYVAEEMREYMAQMGFRTVTEMIGRTDRLEMTKAIEHWKAKGLDLTRMLYQPEVPENVGNYCQISQNHGIQDSLDVKMLLKICEGALKRGEKVHSTLPIENINRVVGTILGSEISKKYGAKGLPEDTIHLHFKGSAGQSFGAFVPNGVTLELEGDANDYTGKGLSGGKMIIYPPAGSTFVPEENIIVGNVSFYGATSGEAYIRGMAGERFCVRNSGVHAVVEAVGDHGCEYMTGGKVVILGGTGRNFAAGMSGGVAYVLDMAGDFHTRCNMQMVDLEKIETAEESEEVRQMVERHAKYTKSAKAKNLLSLWEDIAPKFVKVMPRDYKRALEAMERVKAQGVEGDEAVMMAFEENARDVSRVSGN
ncbi:Glutamate synthase (ferredoxin) [Chloroherpeton thalassium ATCC 35110]|uniref:Glutamate synthase [NADPH] large chain n=1 Tax=Chloroherpeton thalassium (strain ATCC 35110 / GB-78) TaxID=517418 RepID=B3QVL7_CHLT3|nr:glutamate synthase large subunit [Chloroherpeton thalassium]ACF14617.1 Glutamate synthase (ferredoxin) [Chloroherpeton thalassium ATCC 35110]